MPKDTTGTERSKYADATAQQAVQSFFRTHHLIVLGAVITVVICLAMTLEQMPSAEAVLLYIVACSFTIAGGTILNRRNFNNLVTILATDGNARRCSRRHPPS